MIVGPLEALSPGEDRRALADLRERAGPADVVAQRDLVAAIDGKHAVVDDPFTTQLSTGLARANLQRPRRSSSRLDTVGGCENGRAGPDLRQRARAAQNTKERDRVAAIDGQDPVIDQRSRADLPRRSAVAELQCARGDRRSPCVCVARSGSSFPSRPV